MARADHAGAVEERAASGVLCLVVGPSGAGKDTLIEGARARLGDDFHFPRRLITRPADAGGEDHEAVTEARFEALAADGGLALCWRAHGLRYGVPASAIDPLFAGRHVVVNVSRTVLDDARSAFPSVRILSVNVPEARLLERLTARGREPREAVLARVARATAFTVEGADVIEIANDGDVETGIERFVAALRGVATAHAQGMRSDRSRSGQGSRPATSTSGRRGDT